jgi:Protein of unknown function (DUF3606)
MTDDLSKRGPQDRARIDVNQDWELRYWSKELSVSADEIRSAVHAVGPSTDKVRVYLRGKKDRPTRAQRVRND